MTGGKMTGIISNNRLTYLGTVSLWYDIDECIRITNEYLYIYHYTEN